MTAGIFRMPAADESDTFPGLSVIQIDGEGRDADALAHEIVERLRNLSMADYGRTDLWGQT